MFRTFNYFQYSKVIFITLITVLKFINYGINYISNFARILIPTHRFRSLRAPCIQDENGQTAIHYAAKMGQPRIVQMLLEKSSDANLRDKGGKTALNYILEKAIYENIKFTETEVQQTLELLLEKSTDNTKDTEGKTPLHLAVHYGKLQIVEWLLAKSVDVNVQDEQGQTALHYVAKRKRERDAVWSYKRHKLECSYCVKNEPKIVGLLLNTPVDVNMQDSEKMTPLHYAAEQGRTKIAHMLIRKSAQVNLPDNLGKTPLHHAAERGHLSTVKLLLKESADREIQDSFNKLPIHYAEKATPLKKST